MPSDYLELRNLLEDFAYRAIKDKPSDLVTFGLEFFQKIKAQGGKIEPKQEEKTRVSDSEDADVVHNIKEYKNNDNVKKEEEEPIYQNMPVDEYQEPKRAESNETIYESTIDDAKAQAQDDETTSANEDNIQVFEKKPETAAEILAQDKKPEKPENSAQKAEIEIRIPEKKEVSPTKSSFFSRFSRQSSGDEIKKTEISRCESLTKPTVQEEPKNSDTSEPTTGLLRRESSLNRSFNASPAAKSPVQPDSGSLSRSESLTKATTDTPSVLRRESLNKFLPSFTTSESVEQPQHRSSITRSPESERKMSSPSEPSTIERTSSLSRSYALPEEPKSPARSSSMTRSFISDNKEEDKTAKPKSNSEATNNFFSKLMKQKFGSSQLPQQ